MKNKTLLPSSFLIIAITGCDQIDGIGHGHSHANVEQAHVQANEVKTITHKTID